LLKLFLIIVWISILAHVFVIFMGACQFAEEGKGHIGVNINQVRIETDNFSTGLNE